MSQVIDDSISLLAGREPFALVISAHACVLLNKVSPFIGSTGGRKNCCAGFQATLISEPMIG
jgi:hypothetical protein